MMTSETFGPYRVHKLAHKLPMLNGDRFAELVADIRKHGQRMPCIVWGDVLVDGRNRWRACEAAGVAPRVELVDLADDRAAVALIASMANRRDMTATERAMFAASQVEYFADEAKARQVANLRRGTEVPVTANLREREVEKTLVVHHEQRRKADPTGMNAGSAIPTTVGSYDVKTLGWRPGCDCVCTVVEMGEVDQPFAPIPCTVLDPFLGSGTTAYVARKHGRRSIGIELNPAYADLAAKRMQQQSLFALEGNP